MAKPLRYRRRPGLDTRLVDGEAFVITRSTIQHLNRTATLVWLVLEIPSPQALVVDVLQDAYRQVPRRQLSLDAGRMLRQLRQMGLASANRDAESPS